MKFWPFNGTTDLAATETELVAAPERKKINVEITLVTYTGGNVKFVRKYSEDNNDYWIARDLRNDIHYGSIDIDGSNRIINAKEVKEVTFKKVT